MKKLSFAKKNTASSIPSGIAWGLVLSLIMTLVGVVVTAILLDKEWIKEEAVGYGAVITLMISTCAGAIMAAKRIKRLRMQMCLLSGGVYYVSLLIVTALFFGGQYEGMGVTALVVLGCAVATGFLGANGGIKKKTMRFKKAYR